ADQRLDTLISVPANTTATWNYDLPNGDYLVTVASGDPASRMGPQRVRVEGLVIIDNVITASNTYTVVNDFPVKVADGKLTVAIGGSTGNTALNYLIIKSLQQPDTDGDGLSDSDETLLKTDPLRFDTDGDGFSDAEELAQGSNPIDSSSPSTGKNWIRINFQPPTTPVPSGYKRDDGSTYDRPRGYGWTAALPTRARGMNPDPRLDTFVYAPPGYQSTWNYTLPNGKYQISLASGDPQYW